MDELTIEAKTRMEKSIVSMIENFNTLRTGRASSSLLDRISCEYYGDMMPINQICAISIPEARQILVKPFDKGDVKNVYAAICASEQNLNPINDGDSIRINIPPLTEDKRKELVKKAKVFLEEAKVSVRNIRREYLDFIKKSDEYSEDLSKRITAEIDKVTNEMVANLEKELSSKEKDIMSI